MQHQHGLIASRPLVEIAHLRAARRREPFGRKRIFIRQPRRNMRRLVGEFHGVARANETERILQGACT
jgi:hypothetical protein